MSSYENGIWNQMDLSINPGFDICQFEQGVETQCFPVSACVK